MSRPRVSRLPKYLEDSDIPDNILRVYSNINRLPVSDDVKITISKKVKADTCDVGELDNFFKQMNISSTKPNEEVMANLNKEMQRLGLGLDIQHGGDDDGDDEGSPQSKGLALLITALEQQTELDQQQQIVTTLSTKQYQLLGYATQFYNQFLTKADNCIQYAWTDTLKASLGSYITGKLALITISNSDSLIDFIRTLTTTMTPYVSAGTGIVATTAAGLIIKKVVGHYAKVVVDTADSKTTIIKELNEKVNGMSNEEVVNAIKDQSTDLTSAIAETINSIKLNDTDALAKLLPKIKDNLVKPDEPRTSDDMLVLAAMEVKNPPDSDRKRRRSDGDDGVDGDERVKGDEGDEGDEGDKRNNKKQKVEKPQVGGKKSKKRRITKKKKHIKRKATKKKKYSKSKTKRKVHKKK